jgi:hypothetical protein
LKVINLNYKVLQIRWLRYDYLFRLRKPDIDIMKMRIKETHDLRDMMINNETNTKETTFC